MCDFAIAVGGSPNQREFWGDSESSGIGADAIKVVITEDKVLLGPDRLEGPLLASGQDNYPSNGEEFLVDINSFDEFSTTIKQTLPTNGTISVTIFVDKERKIATLTVANGKQKISGNLSSAYNFQLDMYGNAMRLSARYFENHCYTTNVSSVKDQTVLTIRLPLVIQISLM